MQQKSTQENIENEANNGLKNTKGSIAMARTSAPHSASSQFFINVKDNSFLDFTSETPQGWGYAVFGQVIDGIEVVETIENVTTGIVGPYSDVPKEAVIIEKASVINN
jgi:peptidyl-prolyl cis-trans isomerase B (cyclophilin B)